MKIKEAEQLTGIPAANIRYYEREGLLKPRRSKENNYRDYTEEDLGRLRQIKILRLLGISLEEIQRLYQNDDTLEEVIAQRLEKIRKEEQDLREVRMACETILENNILIEDLDQRILTGDKELWRRRLERVLTEDMSRSGLTQRTFNLYIGFLLIWGYALYLAIAVLAKSWLAVSRSGLWLKFWSRDYARPGGMTTQESTAVMCYFIMIILLAACGIAAWWSAKIIWQAVCLHLSILIGAPVLFITYTFFANDEQVEKMFHFFPVFFVMLAGYLLILLLIQKKWQEVFQKTRNIFGLALLASVPLTLIGWAQTGEIWTPLVFSLIFTLYTGVLWSFANQDAKGEFTKYYALICAGRILNPMTLTLSYWGRSKTPLWVDWNK